MTAPPGADGFYGRPANGWPRLATQEVITTGETVEGREAGSHSTATATDGSRLVSELERLLREPGCPVCRYVEESERSFFTWFQIESFTASEMQARLRAGVGMCPAHSRRLVADLGESDGHIMNTVMRHALAGARQTLRDGGQFGPCPACDAVAFGSQRARNLLLEGLADRGQARVYADHDGICLPHLIAAAEAADRDVLKLLAERLVTTLVDRHETLLGVIGGIDHDASRRGVWRERLPLSPADGSTVARLQRRLESGSCPVCLARGQAHRCYVHWFAEHTHQRDPSLQTDPGQLCAAHLHDVATLDDPAATLAARRQRDIRLGQLERLLAHLERDRPPTRGRRGRRGTSDAPDPARTELASTEHCPACHARDGAEQSQLALVNASLALREVRDGYEHNHGLCLRHALRVTDNRTAGVVQRHTDARLSVLSWEVEETARKYAWAYRHEPRGSEADAWVRAMAQIDGQVFEGGQP